MKYKRQEVTDQLGRDDYYDVEDEDYGERPARKGHQNGERRNNGYHYHAREVDVAQIPSHLLDRLTLSKGSGAAALSAEEAEGSGENGAWIIQCPKDVDLSRALEGKKISLNGNPTMLNNEEESEGNSGSSGETYETVASIRDDADESVLMLLPESTSGFRIVSIPLNGFISVRLHVDEIEAPEIIPEKKKTRKLPSGIKERHCFLPDPSYPYVTKTKANMKLKEPVEERLKFQESPEKLSRKPKNKKLNVKQEYADTDIQEIQIISSYEHQETSAPKKKRKKSATTTDEEQVDHFVVPENLKKKKKKRESEEIVELEVEDQPVVVESPKKKKNKKKSESEELIEVEDHFDANESLKKKKKKRNSEEIEIENHFVTTESPKKKNKRKAEEMEDHFVYDESPKKKKNKKQRTS